jgi:T5SS/PEP-CTERM-associated repeat protein
MTRSCWLRIGALLAAGFVGSPADATRFWKSSVSGGAWSGVSNWSSVSAAGIDNAGPPVALEATRIVHTDGVARTATLDQNTPSLGLVAIDLVGAGSAVNTLSLPSSFNLTASAIGVGGYNGVATTSGRGAIAQSGGTVTTSAGSDLVVGWGAGSSGTYTLSGGALVASQSEFIGFGGTGVFNHSGGTNTVLAGAIGSLNVGTQPGANGTYNLSGSGQLVSNKSVYIGDQGSGSVFQTGGAATVTGTNSLFLGFSPGGSGTYAISGGTLNVGNDLVVGVSGSGSFNVSGTAVASIADNVTISSTSGLNLTGGTLRLNTITGINRMNYIGGTLQLAGNRNLSGDSTIGYFFGSNPIIGSGRRVVVEGAATVGTSGGASFSISGTQFTSNGILTVGQFANFQYIGTINISNGAVMTNAGVVLGRDDPGVPVRGIANVVGAGTTWTTGDIYVGDGGEGALSITGGANVMSGSAFVGAGNNSLPATVIVSGAGSTWTVASVNLGNGYPRPSTLTVSLGSVVSIGSLLRLSTNSTVTLDGGTLRFDTLLDEGDFRFNSGTIQLGGARDVGSDAVIAELFGAAPTVTTGKGLTVEGAATISRPLSIVGGTFRASSITLAGGGALEFDRGVLELIGGTITGLAQLNVPTNGEFRVSGVQEYRVVGAAGSTIAATGNLSLGSSLSVAGFGTQGQLVVGSNNVSLLDANAAVLDSLSMTTIGAGSNPGTLTADNGLVVDFGANVIGFGSVGTPNTIAKPLVNNGHIAGNSGVQPLTLGGLVKGVGTFDNVVFTGTFAPGLSPTSLVVGSIGLSDSSTLVMELGGTTPGSGYDQVLASSELALDGTLEVTLVNGFTPSAGQSFNLFDWSSVGGAFDTITLPTLGGGLAWNTSLLYSSGVLSVTIAGVPGDYNNDGQVDAADYTSYRDALGSTTTLPNDTTPGSVTAADYTVWASNYGAVTSSGSTIPEPTGFAILVVAIGALSPRSRVRLLVRRAQVLLADVCVDLRRGQTGVAEHLLHAADVGPTVEQVRREAVPQRVGRGPQVEPRHLQVLLERAGDAACREPLAEPIGEQRGRFPLRLARGELAVGEPLPQRLGAIRAEVREAFLPAFSADAEQPLLEVEIAVVGAH